LAHKIERLQRNGTYLLRTLAKSYRNSFPSSSSQLSLILIVVHACFTYPVSFDPSHHPDHPAPYNLRLNFEMDTVPPEILAHIFECLPEERVSIKSTYGSSWRPELAQFSPVSKACKASIERLTFQKLTITTDELDAFAAIFGGENISRPAALTELTFVFILPPPHNPAGCCAVVRAPDREADSAAFSASVIKLFTILAQLAARAPGSPTLSLQLFKACRVSESQEPSGSTAVPCMPPYSQHQHPRRQVLEAKAVQGQFELMCERDIPVVPCITRLDFRAFRDLDDLKPTWIPAIMARLPNLEQLFMIMYAPYTTGRHRRHAQRERGCLIQCLHDRS
jgi:hypothetical protein